MRIMSSHKPSRPYMEDTEWAAAAACVDRIDYDRASNIPSGFDHRTFAVPIVNVYSRTESLRPLKLEDSAK